MKRLLDFFRDTKVKMNALQAILLLFCFVMQILSGFSCQWNELPAFLKINSAVAGIYLQIHASLLSLTIALVAVMSGLISDSYMGISYTDFRLNIRPIGYNQHTIIKRSLAFIAIAALSFWFQLYYLVAGFLFCEILLIYISVCSIYSIFKGKQSLQKEIKDYTRSMQVSQPQCYIDKFFCGVQKEKTKEIQYYNAKDIQNKFIEAFSEALNQGSECEYKEYASVLHDITRMVWENRNDSATVYPLERYQGNLSKIIYVCINSSNPNSALLALRLIDCVYEDFTTCIKKTCIKRFKGNKDNPVKDSSDLNIPKNEPGDSKKQFKLRRRFQLVSAYEYITLLRKTNIKEIEKKVKISRTLFNMNLVDMALFYEQCEADEDWTVDATVLGIQSYLGQYIAEQKQKGELPSIGYWSRPFWFYFFKADKVSFVEQALIQFYLRSVANAGITYTCGLLTAGCFDIVQEGLYRSILAIPSFCNDSIMRIVAAVHAFIYYMTTREEKDCVGAELQEQAKIFWKENAATYNSFIRFNPIIKKLWIENLDSEYRTDCVEGELLEKHSEKSGWIKNVLKSFDFKMRSSESGLIILPEAVTDFCLFSILYNTVTCENPLQWMQDKNYNVKDFICYIQTGNKENLKHEIIKYVNFIMEGSSEKNKEINVRIAAQSNHIFEQLVVNLSSLFKEKKIKEVRKQQSEYLKNLDAINNKKERWKTEILKAISDKFDKDIDFLGDGEKHYHSVKLFKFSTYTDSVEEALNESHKENVIANLIDSYIQLLIAKGHLDKKVHKEFKDDQDYIQYLHENLFSWMVGSEFLLMNQDYRLSEKFKEATKDYRWIKNTGCNYAMAVRKESLRFYLKDITISIRSSVIQDESIIKKDNYSVYEPIQDVPVFFKEEELKEYIGQEKKVIEITAKIAVDVYGNIPIGIYFANEYSPALK